MSETVRFVAANQSQGTGDAKDTTNGEEMHEFITFNRQLSRPTDHFRPPRLAPDNPYAPPPKTSQTPHTYFTKFLRDPIGTSLNSFSRVTNLVTSPTFYDDDYHSYLAGLHISRPPGTAERVSRGDNSENNELSSDSITLSGDFNGIETTSVHLPPPSLPAIACTEPQFRLPPLTPQEFEEESPAMTVQQLLERVFRGVSIRCI